MKVTIYSTGCPKCKVLEAKLNHKNIKYDTITDVDEMTKLGFMSMPMMRVEYDDKEPEVLDFSKAVAWINSMDFQLNTDEEFVHIDGEEPENFNDIPVTGCATCHL